MLTANSSTTRRSTRVAREIVTEYRRRAILCAARTVFAKRGFAATNMEAVAREADVAKGTLYLYFRSKAALYRAAVSTGLEQITTETLEALGSGRPFREVLSEFFRIRDRYFHDQQDLLRIYSAEMAALGSTAQQIRRDVARVREQQIGALERAIIAAEQAGAVRAVDTSAVARAVFDLSHGRMMRRIRHDDDGEQDDTAAIVDLLWRGFAL